MADENGGGAGGAGGSSGAGATAGGADPAKIAAGGADPQAGAGGSADPAKTAGGADPAAAGAAAPKPGEASGWTETNWRETYAGADESKLNVLKRYPSLKDALDASFTARGELQKLMSERAPAKDAPPEQVAAWRKSQGVPEKADGYFAGLPQGVSFNEKDKPLIMSALEAAHARGDKPDVVNSYLTAYHAASTKMLQEIAQSDVAAKQSYEQQMNKEWGGEYIQNQTLFKEALTKYVPAEFHKAFENMRVGDDKATPAINHPAFVKMIVQMSREANPAGINTGGGSGIDNLSSIESKLQDYALGKNGLPKVGSKAWFKDSAAQADQLNLLRAQERFKGTKKTG